MCLALQNALANVTVKQNQLLISGNCHTLLRRMDALLKFGHPMAAHSGASNGGF